MVRKVTLCLCLAAVLAATGVARAGAYLTPVRIAAGPLDRTLEEISRQTGAELLYDHALVVGLKARGIEGSATPIAAVEAALAGTRLRVRRGTSGALIIEAPAAAPLAQQDAPVAEVLVIGRRTQNADIRRQETDIQPYRVFTGEQIVAAHVDDLGQYFDTRVTTDAAVLAPGGGLTPGQTNSQIDLRGLGVDQTLVLIDGRRMPDFPSGVLGFAQPDLNALPLHAIDRVETLTGSAGGIFGFGALGGVVNVVLAHDRPGAEAHLTLGVTGRDDAGRATFEGRLEYSPDHGATELMLDVGFSNAQPLTTGQRSFLSNDRQATAGLDPSDLVTLGMPHGDGIGVFNVFSGQTLVLKPQYGGVSLGAAYTFLPPHFEGTDQDLAAALLSHAGQLNLGVTDGEAASDLGGAPRTGAVLVNVRHRFGAGVEAYFDGVMLWNHGRYIDTTGSGADYLPASSPANPFQQPIFVSFPASSTVEERTNFDTARFTAGLLAPLPLGWRATAETTWGVAAFSQFVSLVRSQYDGYSPFYPLGSWTAMQAVLAKDQSDGVQATDAITRYGEQSLRLAGPAFHTAAGDATLTLLAEHRTEAVPAYAVFGSGSLASTLATVAPHATVTTSAYAELRAPIFADTAPTPLLRGLELQLAIRGDREANTFSVTPTDPTSQRMHVVFAGASYTAGAKVSPLAWLMLRGSFATGQTPPPLADLVTTVTTGTLFLATDPKRPNDFTLRDYDDRTGGSPALKTIRASTASVGVVLTPFGPHGLRLSLDYSHIRRSNDVVTLSDQIVLDHEDLWPQRVQRAPLTDADRALGYTAGPVTFIDSTAINGASLTVRTLDARLDGTFAVPVGWLHLYGSGAYNFEHTFRQLFRADVQTDGYLDGPLSWRANLGGDWSLGALTVGLNVQFYAGSRIAESFNPSSMISADLQGSDRIPPQTYLDLHVARRFHVGRGGFASDLKIDLGISNLLDTAPPRLTSVGVGGGGYSPYGDPRRRRFEVSLNALF